MPNREFVMLAKTFDPSRHRIGGMFLSEKLDGMRCLWLPFTRGKSIKDIPFANREKDQREYICTGLWSRYGKVIHCPDKFVEGFPNYPLDGELYLGRGQFQKLMSTVKTLIAVESAWENVRFVVFDSPTYHQVFTSGRINNPQYKHTMILEKNIQSMDIGAFDFTTTYDRLQSKLDKTRYLQVHEQQMLPRDNDSALSVIEHKLNELVGLGGEGLMLRYPQSLWEPIRSNYLLKVKKLHDSEGTIIGYRAGQGKYLGMLGSLRIKWYGIAFELSGFTDEERTLSEAGRDWAMSNPGDTTDNAISYNFSIGQSITFCYRELTNDGVPKEARYLRHA